MKAITTKFLGWTDHRPTRIKASDSDGNSITLTHPGGIGEGPHRYAAEALCLKMGWTGNLAGGSIRNGYVFVFCSKP